MKQDNQKIANGCMRLVSWFGFNTILLVKYQTVWTTNAIESMYRGVLQFRQFEHPCAFLGEFIITSPYGYVYIYK